MGSCIAFTTQAEKFTDILAMLEKEKKPDQFGVPESSLHSNSSSTLHETTNRALSKIEESFLYHMKLLIDALNFYSTQETVQFLCLVVRLDYNQFYNNSVKTRERAATMQTRTK